MRPDVSYIVPVFNNEAYLRQCLASVLGQSLRSSEVVCVNDGSADGSGDILREIMRLDPRVRVIDNGRNLGTAAARNRGLTSAAGRFVRMVDADDLLPLESTRLLFERAVETNSDAVRGSLAQFQNDDRENLRLLASVADQTRTEFRSDSSLWVPWWHTSYLISNDLIKAGGLAYPNLRRGEDPVFMANVLVRSNHVSHVPDIVYLYRKYSKSTGSAGASFADVVDSFTHAAAVKHLYRQFFPPAWDQAYGPYLLEDFRKFIARCRLDTGQAEFVDAKAAEIWGPGTSLMQMSTGAIRAPAPAEGKVLNKAERDYWNFVFRKEDPWGYGSAYEQTKYGHTLELMPDRPATSAIEVGCAEGLFTEMLAPRVGRLLAVDISDVALNRARQRCCNYPNVSFAHHDISEGIAGSGYDLVVCSEILYYLRDGKAVELFAERVRDSLAAGGHLLLTHANMVSDDRNETGFDFNEIGTKFIAGVFASRPGLEFLRELRTELYRIQLFRRVVEAAIPAIPAAPGSVLPQEVLLRKSAEFHHPAIKWGGCAVTAAEARHLHVTRDVPVLMYHRVADDGPAALAPYRISAAAFERQLAWLKRHGWTTITMQDYFKRRFVQNLQEMAGKLIVLSFDDAYTDFYHTAWPLLRRYGVAATVFVPTDFAGGRAEWDNVHGTPAEIMTWDQIIELRAMGIEFDSHSSGHQRVNELARDDLFADAVKSRKILHEKLGSEIHGYCYPYAYANPASRRVIGEAGYQWAVCGLGGHPPERNDPFYIPRIEILGHDTLDDFIAKLPAPEVARESSRLRYHELRSRRDRATYMNC